MLPFIHVLSAQAVDAMLRLEALRPLARVILAAMFAMAPMAQPRIGQESPDALRARYQAIAYSIAAAAQHPEPWEARRRAGILLGIARHEAGLFEVDVDTGPCRSAAGDCDGGISVSLWQLQLRDLARRHVFQTNRDAAAAEALRIALGSERRCPAFPYAIYASGGCVNGKAAAELVTYVGRAQLRVALAQHEEDDPYGR